MSDPELLRGSLITLRRKCGKAWCHCATGGAHETPALSFSVGGRTRMLTLSADEVGAVRAAVERYQAARAELDARAAVGLEILEARLGARRRGRGRR